MPKLSHFRVIKSLHTWSDDLLTRYYILADCVVTELSTKMIRKLTMFIVQLKPAHSFTATSKLGHIDFICNIINVIR